MENNRHLIDMNLYIMHKFIYLFLIAYGYLTISKLPGKVIHKLGADHFALRRCET